MYLTLKKVHIGIAIKLKYVNRFSLSVTLLALNSPDGQSMIGVTAGGQIVHTCRKANSNFSVRVLNKVNCDKSVQSKRNATQQDTEDSTDNMNFVLSEEKMNDCKFVLSLRFCKMSVQGVMTFLVHNSTHLTFT